MKIYEVLWDEDEYGYDVAMCPPLVFTTREVAEKAAQRIAKRMTSPYIISDRPFMFVKETELLDDVPDDIDKRHIGRSYGDPNADDEEDEEQED